MQVEYLPSISCTPLVFSPAGDDTATQCMTYHTDYRDSVMRAIPTATVLPTVIFCWHATLGRTYKNYDDIERKDGNVISRLFSARGSKIGTARAILSDLNALRRLIYHIVHKHGIVLYNSRAV
jgi:hypothetical protein